MKIAVETNSGQVFFSGSDLCGLNEWLLGFCEGGIDGKAIEPRIEWSEVGLQAVTASSHIADIVLEHLPPAAREKIKIKQSYTALSKRIYAQYPPDKQAQDDKWSLSYTAKLKAAGVPKLEATVVHIIYLVSQGQALDKLIAEAVAKWPDDVYSHISGSSKAERKAYATHMLTKLVKIGLRAEWAEACIRVGKAAIAAGTEPDFPSLLQM